jgi:hypothetical protein
MRLTIIPVDSFVALDGDSSHRPLDLSDCNIPANVHALQWYGTEGELEFVDNPDRTKPQNEIITVLPDWASACVTVWQAWTPPAPPPVPNPQNQPTTSGTKTA